MKKPLLKIILFFCSLFCFVSQVSLAQEVLYTPANTYYWNPFEGTSSLGVFNNYQTGFTSVVASNALTALNGSYSLKSVNNNVTGPVSGGIYGAILPANTDLTANNYEWSFLYKFSGATANITNTPSTVTKNNAAWRYWVNANNATPSANGGLGIYFAQTGNKLECYSKESDGFTRTLGLNFTLTAGKTYNIKLKRINTGGTYVIYVDELIAGAETTTNRLQTNFGGGLTTYNYSVLECNDGRTAANGNFQWDDFKLFVPQTTFSASPYTPSSTSLIPGAAGVLAYVYSMNVRDVINIKNSYITGPTPLTSYISGSKLYISTVNDFASATLVSSSSVADYAPINNSTAINLSASQETGTTYYFFVTVDMAASFGSNTSFSLNTPNVAYDNNNGYLYFATTPTAGPTFALLTNVDWTGAGANGNWSNTSNWSTGAVPTATSAVRIGVVAYTRQPTITAAPANIGSLTFGTLSGTSPTAANTTLTVNSGFTLEVLGDIVQNHQAGTSGNYSSYITTLTGAGNITCDGNFQVGNTTTAPASTSANLLDISSRINLLTIKGNVILNAVGNNGTGLNYPAFDIDDKKVLLNGQIVTTATNSPTNNYYSGANANYSGIGIFCMDNNSNASTLELTNNTPIANFLTNMIIDFNNNGSGAGTVIYNSSSGNQTVYTQANTPYVGTNPDHYENLILTGASTKVFNGTSVNIGGSLTSSTGPVNFNTNNPVVTIDVDWVNSAVVTQSSGLITVSGSLTNSGTLNLGSANLTIAGNYTNTGTYSQGSGTTIFNGTTQSLIDNGNGTKFNNVTFQGGGTKTMNTGTNIFSVAPLYTLSVIASSTLAVGSISTTSPLTILSDATGDGSIGSLAAGTITGNINIQRYMKGGTATGLLNGRGYRLLSSPVFNTTTATGSLAYNLIPLKVNTLISGPTGGGFDASPSATPSVFMYDENSPATTAPNSIPASDYKGFATTSDYVPMGNGIMFYFRGNQNVSKTGGSGNAFTGPTFPIAESTTLNFFGQLAPRAGFTVSFPTFKTAPQSLYKTSATATVDFNLYMSQLGPGTNTGTDSTGNSGKRGFNIVGNPYPSAIDLETFYTANRTNAAAVVSLSKYIYFLRRSSASYATSYAVFDASGGKTPGAGASRYVLSGQGFFVRALNSTTTATTAAIKFTEAMKAAYPNGTSPATIPSVFSIKKLAGTKEAIEIATGTADVNTSLDAQLRLELQQDSNVYNTTDISFASIGREKFNPVEDALYLGASGQSNKLYSLTTDSTACFVKYMPELGKTKKIKLGVSFGDSGLYTLGAPIKTNFPPQYAVYLVDTYLKDSLDVTHNPTYNFRVDKSVAASYAADRFYLSVNKVPGYEYRLLDFAGDKITQGVKLNWKTEFEGDNTGFDVERSIDGGKSFIYLGALRSSGIGTYAFTDKSPQIGTNLYRLKQTDIDNKIVYSKIVTIGYQLDNRPLTGLMVYPSTTTRDITISFGKVYADNIKVTMSNALGNVVKTFKTSATDKILSQVSALPVGVYIVTAVDESTGKLIGTSKFVKQ